MTPPTPPPVQSVLAESCRQAARDLQTMAERLEVASPPTLPPHRLLVMAGGVLAQLDDLDRELHRLLAWLPVHRPDRPAEGRE